MTAEEFDELRPSAFAIAYRMLGSVGEAEDVVQEGFLRIHRAHAGGERIESPRAYLSTVVSRLSLDHLRSARVRRETYVGEWLPKPLVASAAAGLARRRRLGPLVSLPAALINDLGGTHTVALAVAGVVDDAARARACSSSTAYLSASKIHASTMAPSRTVNTLARAISTMPSSRAKRSRTSSMTRSWLESVPTSSTSTSAPRDFARAAST